jgi:hypothetical protein
MKKIVPFVAICLACIKLGATTYSTSVIGHDLNSNQVASVQTIVEAMQIELGRTTAPPPIYTPVTYAGTAGSTNTYPVLTNFYDPNNFAIGLASVTATNGTAWIDSSGTNLGYYNTNAITNSVAVVVTNWYGSAVTGQVVVALNNTPQSLIPIMTSSNTPSGYAYGNWLTGQQGVSFSYAGYEPFRAFNTNMPVYAYSTNTQAAITNCWASYGVTLDTPTSFLAYHFGTLRTLVSYNYVAHASDPLLGILQYSTNAGVSWINLTTNLIVHTGNFEGSWTSAQVYSNQIAAASVTDVRLFMQDTNASVNSFYGVGNFQVYGY